MGDIVEMNVKKEKPCVVDYKTDLHSVIYLHFHLVKIKNIV